MTGRSRRAAMRQYSAGRRGRGSVGQAHTLRRNAEDRRLTYAIDRKRSREANILVDAHHLKCLDLSG